MTAPTTTAPRRPFSRPTKPASQPSLPPPAGPKSKVSFGAVGDNQGHRILLYGPGGIGKTTLAAQLPGPVAFFDLEESLPRLKPNLEQDGIFQNVRAVSGVTTWAELRAALQSDGWDEIKSIAIDSGTKAEELCLANMLATVPNEKGNNVQRIEDFGYGKGYQHLFESFLPLLADLDKHTRAGRNVVLICHDCTTNVPNPAGDDWLRFEPRLQSPNSGKASIRLRCREWADHVLFLGYDVDVKDRKGRGSGTRTIYPAELPHCMAKSRTFTQPIPLSPDIDVWSHFVG